jgi:aminopeptidase
MKQQEQMEQTEMMNKSTEYMREVAVRLVRDSLRVKPGDNFSISCSDPYYYPFVEEIALAAIVSGAYPFILMSSDNIARKKFQQSNDYLNHPPDVFLSFTDKIDVSLSIATPRNPDNLRDVPPEKFVISAEASKPLQEKLQEINREKVTHKLSSLILPTPEAAEKYNMTFEEYSELIWSSLDIDYNEMSERANKLLRKLDKADQIHITTDDGTDLKFSIKNRRVFADDGIIGDDDVETGVYMQNLPAGELCCAPIEDSAQGRAVFQYNIVKSEPLVNLRTVFKDGQMTVLDADEGFESFKNYVESQTGEKWRIAELGIGLNPHVTKITGNLGLDEKIIGTVHIAIGENRLLGGTNISTLHRDLVIQKPTVIVDGRMIMERGELLCD